MDKTILKKFAIESRQELMKKIENKIKLFYIDETFNKQQNGDIYILSNESHTLSLSNEEYKKRELLINRVNELGLEQVIEESAYTWFNRLIAIRYMEINDYLPLTKDNQSLGIRVLSSKDNTPDPEIMKFTNLTNPDLDIDFKKEKYTEIKEDNKRFEYILLLICKKLGKVIPQVFDGVTDYIDILIPDNLLNDSGYITKLITEVPEENYNQVEIIGWLYQYYNQTEKDKAMSSKNTYTKTEIPYVTQLFTPDWIVKYMVENSLGKYWIEHNGSTKLIEKWKYFIKQEKFENKGNIKPTEIKCIDPCMGSGHILVYMFEVLYQIYESYGYNKSDIAKTILSNNLYGLDIDDRAGQLSVLSVLLKAREYDKNIFNCKEIKSINIVSIQESTNIKNDNYINLTSNSRELLLYLKSSFKYAKEIGSLINLEPKNYSNLLNEIKNDNTIFRIELEQPIKAVVKQAEILTEKYDIIVTNPPYMSTSKLSSSAKSYINKNYQQFKSDLYSCFIKKCYDMIELDKYIGMITQQSWMFITAFDLTRNFILENTCISTLLHLGTRAFDEISGEIVKSVSYVLKKGIDNNFYGYYYNLTEYSSEKTKEEGFLSAKDKFKVKQSNFKNIPGKTLAYWIDPSILEIFENGEKISKYISTKDGLTTGNNEKFIRFFWEVDKEKIGFKLGSSEDFWKTKRRFAPLLKGGGFRKWYGNNINVITYNSEDFKILEKSGNKLPSRESYFKPCISWNRISSSLCVRYENVGYIFESASLIGLYNDNELAYFIMAFLNSNLSEYEMKILNSSQNMLTGYVNSLALPKLNEEDKKKCSYLAEKCIQIYKEDWDLSENSWDFKKHSLVEFKEERYLSEAIEQLNKKITNNYNNILYYETEINKVFNNAVINNILENEPNKKQINLRKIDVLRDIKSLISYAVGCMFGRYSLDKEGLIYAGGEFDESQYKTFNADVDNIIPISDESYFADDIVSRFKEFIEVVYGKETLSANLDFIAETLGKKGTETSEETIRRYFLNDFYADHIKMYQKKPIYWLFDSGKKNGFKALIYMHRYNENTVPKVRLDYLHKIQMIYERQLSDVNDKLKLELTLSDKKETQKKQAELGAKLQELIDYDEKIAHIANQRISINLDDGVTINYSKFADILAKIK